RSRRARILPWSLVRSNTTLAERRRLGARDRRRCRDHLLTPPYRQPLAAPNDHPLHSSVPVLHRRPSRLLHVPIGRDAARGGLHLLLVRTTWRAPALGCRRPAVPLQPLHAALGMVPDLLRVGDHEARQWRPALARSHGDGRVLPERPVAHMARVVCAALAALVPRRHRSPHPRRRA